MHTTTNNIRTKNSKSTNQGVEIADNQCHNIQQESIQLNIVTYSDIYNNYSYTSCINWEIEKTPETYSKKLEFNINKPETSLKSIDFNIINNFNEIDDKKDDIRNHSSNDLTDDMYNNIDHHNVDQKQTNHNSLYTLANNKLQLSSDLEELDWNSTDSHKGELVIAYNNRVGNKILCPRACYALYTRPNEYSNGHLIYKPSTDQIVVTKDYQIVPVPEDLIDTTSETDSYDKKSQVDNLDMVQSIVHDDQFNNNNDGGNNPLFSDDDQYLHGTVSAILPLQTSVTMPIDEDILHHIQDDISKVVHVISLLLMYLWNKILRSSLLTSL